jgi:puromycin-sensitive aminopeptidase
VRYAPDLLDRLLNAGIGRLSVTERFNLISDAWATTIAGIMALTDYLDLTARFTSEEDKNVWAVLLDSFSFLNRIIIVEDRPALEAFVRGRVGPAVAALGWVPRNGESEGTKQLRGELIGAQGKLGNDPAIQQRAAELYDAYCIDATAVDPNVVPSLVAILAHIGAATRYDEFDERFRTAATPQEERRYLFSLAAFQPRALLERTLVRTINGYIRTQDAPFLVRHVENTPSGPVLRLFDGTEERLDPSTVTISQEGILYARVKGGRFEARLSQAAQAWMVDSVVEGPDGSAHVRAGQSDHRIGERACSCVGEVVAGAGASVGSPPAKSFSAT